MEMEMEMEMEMVEVLEIDPYYFEEERQRASLII